MHTWTSPVTHTVAAHRRRGSCSNDEPVGGFEVPGQVWVSSGGVDRCRAGRQNRGCRSGDQVAG